MQTKKSRHRWAALTLLMLLVAGVGCARDGLDWQEATSATGNYVAEFPGKPTMKRDQPTPRGDRVMQMAEVESGDDYFALFEAALNGIVPQPLDVAIDGSIEGVRAYEDSAALGPVTVTGISRTTGDFEGVETRKVTYTLDRLLGKKTVTALSFYRNDAMVVATVVYEGDADSEAVDRFLSSLRPRENEPDTRALPQRHLEIGDQVVCVFDTAGDAREAVADRIAPAGAPVRRSVDAAEAGRRDQ
jgi:hypothetical protein